MFASKAEKPSSGHQEGIESPLHTMEQAQATELATPNEDGDTAAMLAELAERGKELVGTAPNEPMMATTLSQRMEILRIALGLSELLAHESKPDFDTVQTLTATHGVSPLWLINGEGPMFTRELKTELSKEAQEAHVAVDVLQAENRKLREQIQLLTGKDTRMDTSAAPDVSADTTKTVNLLSSELVTLNRENRELRAELQHLQARVAAMEAGQAQVDVAGSAIPASMPPSSKSHSESRRT